ncbi:MAG: PxKF domain-containing protein [Ilumatobacteraceae bacterium]
MIDRQFSLRRTSLIGARTALVLGGLIATAVVVATPAPEADAGPSACVSGTDYSTSTTSGVTTATFSNTTACVFTIPDGVSSIDYLVVGGGGGGGGGGLYFSLCNTGTDKAGGGGAGGGGGQVVSSTSSVTAGSTLSIQVGAGGVGGKAGGCGLTYQATYTTDGAGEAGTAGGTSSLGAIASADGGTGGSGASAIGAGAATGGSSGTTLGGTNVNSANDCTETFVTVCFAAPGGAGASAAGSDPVLNDCYAASGGAGGAGTYVSLTAATYGGGGGGSTRHPYTLPCSSGGSRGGGAGGAGGGGAGALGNGVDGTQGLGGGGGGGRGNGSSATNISNAGFGGHGGDGTVVLQYTVVTAPPLTFVGFAQPVDNGGTVNLVKGGAVVPLKFLAYDGVNLMTDPSRISVVAETMSCGAVTNAPSDVIEFTVPGSSALRWDGTQFIHNWRVPTGKNLCYRITYRAADAATRVISASSASELSALFRTR